MEPEGSLPHSQVLYKYNPVYIIKVKQTGKAVALQVWTEPEGSRRLRLPDFKTLGT